MSSTLNPTANAPASTSLPVADHDVDMGEPEDGNGTPSQVSNKQNLRDDLERVLGADFDFDGKFAVSHTFPTSPLPGLHIQGIGVIGFPLSDRDAKLIEAAATQAPFGKGTETVVDTTVRDTFEINPDKFSFQNPAWPGFLSTLVKQVANGLGLPPNSPPPRAELYKLLLYKTGSHFLPHKDTEKAPGMFASLIVVLPSKFEGGQVHVSHGNNKDVFDVSPSSAFATSALAWYTDVIHQVKPITSGYRLALSYNLINPSPGIPPPHLPDMHSAVSEVEAIFRKWRAGGYANSDYIAYLLDHQYSKAGLVSVALKGRDATLVSNIRRAAENQGVSLLLGLLECEISGDAGADHPPGCRGYGRYGGCWGYSDSEDEDDYGPPTGMELVHETEYRIEGLYELDGDPMGDGDVGPIIVDPELGLIPQCPFEDDENPDDQEFEGYTGNEGAPMTYWYRRSVLVMSLVDEETATPLGLAGPGYALKKLKKWRDQGPTEKNKAMAWFLTSHLSRPEHLSTLMDLALEWKDSTMFQEILEKCSSGKLAPQLSSDMFIRAWAVFTFDRIEDILGVTLRERCDTKVALGLINDLQSRVTGEDQNAKMWLKQQITAILSKIKSAPTVADVQTYVDVAKSEGLPFFSTKVAKQLVNFKPNFDFWVGLAEGLWKNKRTLLPSECTPEEASTNKSALNRTLNALVTAAIAECSSPPVTSYPYYPYVIAYREPGRDQSRVLKLLDLMVLTRRTKRSDQLIPLTFQAQGDLMAQYRNSINPLISKLKDRYQQYGSSHFSVLDAFMRTFIERWLQDLLGRPSKRPETFVKTVNCACTDCIRVNQFLLSDAATETFWAAQKRRSHMEATLRPLSSALTYTTITGRSPYGLEVTKTEETLATARWNGRLVNTRAFLALVGTRDVLERIMGERYQDVEAALAGTKPYKISKPAPVAAASAESAPMTQATSSGTQTSLVVAGVKRKAEDDGDTIDLTSD